MGGWKRRTASRHDVGPHITGTKQIEFLTHTTGQPLSAAHHARPTQHTSCFLLQAPCTSLLTQEKGELFCRVKAAETERKDPRMTRDLKVDS